MTIYKKTIPVKNVFYMLYYASEESSEGLDLLKLSNLGEVATEEFDDIRDLFAAMLSRGIGRQLKQGLYREYIAHEEDIPTVRGRINITGTIRNRIAQKQLLTCEYDELSENTLSNRILKTTAMLLLRDDGVREERKEDLRKEMRYFSNVEEIDPGAIRWSLVRFHRNNQDYRLLIFICRLILQKLLLTTENGDYVLQSFADEDDEDNFMANIYEWFLRGYYKRHYPDLVPNASQIKWFTKDQDNALPEMYSDIMLTHNKEVLIIDAKWVNKPKSSGGHKGYSASKNASQKENSGKIKSNYLYQILAYVKNEAANRNVGRAPNDKIPVSGVLLYAQTYEMEDGKPQKPLTDLVLGGPYNMGGNWIHVRSVDLTKDFDGIKEQLNGFAEEFKKGEFSKPPVPATQTP